MFISSKVLFFINRCFLIYLYTLSDIKDNTRRICVGDRVVVDLRVSPSPAANGSSTSQIHSKRNGSKTPTLSSPDISPNSSNFYISSCSSSSLNSHNLSNDSLCHAAIGIVRFVGTVSFTSGYWIGVELDDAIGSNDGSINGVRYFDCRAKHGVFAAPSRVVK